MMPAHAGIVGTTVPQSFRHAAFQNVKTKDHGFPESGLCRVRHGNQPIPEGEAEWFASRDRGVRRNGFVSQEPIQSQASPTKNPLQPQLWAMGKLLQVVGSKAGWPVMGHGPWLTLPQTSLVTKTPKDGDVPAMAGVLTTEDRHQEALHSLLEKKIELVELKLQRGEKQGGSCTHTAGLVSPFFKKEMSLS